MWRTKLCLGLMGLKPTAAEEIQLIHETGFEAFFTGWGPNSPIGEWKKLADDLGMMYQSIHAPFHNAAKMWTECEGTQAAIDEQLACLRACAENEVPIMVAHAFIGFKDHSPSDFGVSNFEIIVKEAERLGVKVAFENTEGEEYLMALMELAKSYKSVGFCWDTGHEMCYNYSKDMPGMFKDLLICTHLNDNLGIKDYNGEITWIDDLHLLPFDGIADWDDIAARLVRSNFTAPLTFELGRGSKPNRHENDLYGKMTSEEYIAEAYKRACRVAALVQKHAK
ncbi:MAG: TIM barrel protein [Clostridia bacterium]|nr:TIM barrel protein [Clostridia bacterium]MBO5257979.1 TIM barrel protein [Clostridia bacterium]MBP3293611.1 TIM barrel protein [Clostridia bacterium]